MIDPELAAMVDLLPKIDLADPVAARAGLRGDARRHHGSTSPGSRRSTSRTAWCPGWEGDPDVPVRVYRPQGDAGRRRRVPGVLMIHGGGFVIGSVEAEHAGAALTAIDTGAVVVSVDYRLAPEHPYPAGLHDCYAALSYLHAEADALGRRPGAGGAGRGERRRRAGGGDRAAGPRPRRPAGLLPDAAHPRARRPARDAVDADVRGLAAVEPAAGREELAGLSRRAVRDRRRAGLRGAGPGRRTSAGCRRPTSRRPRTTRCATRGSPTPSACCRPASRSSCTSSPAPSTAPRW